MSDTTRTDWDHHAVIGWLLSEGRHDADLHRLTTLLGQRLEAAGAPVYRLRISMRTVHPLVRAVSSTWETGGEAVPAIEARHGFERNPSYAGSPIQMIVETGQPFRRRLETPPEPGDHVILHELRDAGATDYLGLPLPYSDGGQAILIANCRQPGGFVGTDTGKLATVAAALAPVVEVLSARQTALAVAEAYLGPRTGRRVLDGQITRGDIDTVEAAILVSDMRGWTRLNAERGPRAALALANRYFEVIADAVAGEGGEILKFLGDGVLAVFPADAGQPAACRAALAAADRAIVAAVDGDLGVPFGIGLHVGEVLYGNVGSARRIDFTVLGQAVNIAARVEALCGALREPLLFTGEFAGKLGLPVRQAGLERLKGIDGPVPVFTLD